MNVKTCLIKQGKAKHGGIIKYIVNTKHNNFTEWLFWWK